MSEKLQKMLLHSNGYQLDFGFDFQKANDATQRTVVGFATLDNIDTEGDVILASASEEAFRMFRGNIREQHNTHSAVGRMIAFEPAEYVDPKTNKVYKGIRVAVRVSEGAENTWKKCLDGTYSAFSIRGAILDYKTEYNEELGKEVRIVTKYRLTELSLVDNPGNDLANFETVYKAADGNTDLQKSFETKNLFWCPAHSLGAKSKSESYSCASCGENMARIGTISENEDIIKKIHAVLAELEINTEGVNPQVSKKDELEKSADDAETVDATTTDEQVTAETAVNTNAETAKETNAEETKSDGVDLESALAELAQAITQVNELVTQKVNDLQVSVDEKLTKLIASTDEVAEKLEKSAKASEELQKSLETTKDRVEKIAEGTAVQKSQDLEKSVSEEDKEDEWDGIFTKTLRS